MRKIVLLLLLLLTTSSICFSASSRLYDKSSDEFQTIQKLCSLTGVLGPTNASPMTENELYLAYQKIDPSKLNERNYKEYVRVGKIFSDKEKSFDLKAYINPFFYFTGMQDSLDNEEFLMPYRDMPQFINYGFDASFADHAYLELLMEEANYESIKIFNEEGYEIGKKTTVYNTSFDSILRYDNGKFYSVFTGGNPVIRYEHMPSIARGAIATNHISLIMGRTKQSLGGGYSGNVLVSDNFRYQEVLQLAFYNDRFNYRLNITHFDSQNSNGKCDKSLFSGKQQNRLVHRMDFDITKIFRLSVNFAFMLYSDSAFDIRFLTPLMFVHNWYNFNEEEEINERDEANNALALEFDYMIFDGFTLRGQFILDQMMGIGQEETSVPNALGGLLSISFVDSYRHFDAEYFIEAYYSTPSLYLNKKRDNGNRDWNRDWIVGYGRGDGEIHYSGHPYGPDAIAISCGALFDFTEIKLKSQNYIEYKIKGEQGKFSEFSFNYTTPTGIAENRLTFRSYNQWMATESLTICADLGLSYYQNYMHKKDVNKIIPQLSLGLKWELL